MPVKSNKIKAVRASATLMAIIIPGIATLYATTPTMIPNTAAIASIIIQLLSFFNIVTAPFLKRFLSL